MRWTKNIWRWSSLGLAVTAIGGGLMFGKHYAEKHALTAVMGPGAHASAIKLHWPHRAGCAENVVIPLAGPDDPGFSTVELSAGRLWFSYDLPALLRKHLVLPRVVIEDALIQARTIPEVQSASRGSASATSDEVRAAAKWLTELRGRMALLEQEKFVSGTQVAVDTAMLSEQWRTEFSSMHDRAQRILSEARDIQQQLAALDNVLRHEGRVIASRDRLEVLKAALTGMKSELSRSDRTLRDQQSRIREALLVEKNSMLRQGVAYRSPAAGDVAEDAVKLWLANCLAEPAQVSRLLADMIHKPYAARPSHRGADIRYPTRPTPDLSVVSAKLSGNILLDDNTMPFSATCSFRRMPVDQGRESTDADDAVDDARWQVSVGSSLACMSLEGFSLDARAGRSKIEMHSTAPGQIQAECEMSPSTMRGTGELQLRQWLSQASGVDELKTVLAQQPLLLELIAQSLVSPENVPEVVQFGFSGSINDPELEIDDDASRWLADELTRLASERVAQHYDAAAQKLDATIHRDLDAMTRSVAIGRDQALQYLNQLIDELRVVQISILDNLQQRSGAHFARQPENGVKR